MSAHDDERSRLMAEQERLLRAGVPIAALAKLAGFDAVVTEPAEERCGCGHAMAEHRVGASDYSCRSCSCDLATPAVPVVHPEPGDRADGWNGSTRTDLCNHPYWLHTEHGFCCIYCALHDPFVAAAVAAVRADLAERIERAAETEEMLRRMVKNANDERARAAALGAQVAAVKALAEQAEQPPTFGAVAGRGYVRAAAIRAALESRLG